MKHFKRLVVIGLILFVFVAEASEKRTETTQTEKKIIAYYFHGSYRCPSCITIEEWSHAAISTYFQKDINEGKLLWKAVNIEESENRHFINDYGLYTKTLIIAEFKGEKQTRWKNLDKVWQFLRNQQQFTDYVKDEVKGYMEDSNGK